MSADTVVTAAPPRSLPAGLLKLVRPKQWAKNGLVFAAPMAAGVIGNWDGLWRTLVAFVAFCAAAGGGYVVNDLVDVEADRAHPTKWKRPIASGVVSVRTARVATVVLFASAVAIAATTGRVGLVGAILVYEAVVILYSLELKHIAVVDVVTVAAGFVIRAVGGAEAVSVPVSNWFLIVTSLGSLLVVTGKRYGELRQLGVTAATEVRATLGKYSQDFLRTLLASALAGTVIAYCLFAFERAQTADHPVFFELSIIPVVTALLRYALLLDRGEGAAPEDVFLADRTLQALGLAWAALFAAGVYA